MTGQNWRRLDGEGQAGYSVAPSWTTFEAVSAHEESVNGQWPVAMAGGIFIFLAIRASAGSLLQRKGCNK